MTKRKSKPPAITLRLTLPDAKIVAISIMYGMQQKRWEMPENRRRCRAILRKLTKQGIK